MVNCAYTELISVGDLNEHPKNANKHSDQQLKLLEKLMGFHGFRHPIIVSKRSGFIVAGHARLTVAKSLKYEKVPVDYQDFADDAAEYSFLISDNEIARLAQTDLSQVLSDVLELGPDFDFDLLGIPDFKLPEDFNAGTEDDQGQLDQKQLVFMECPHCQKQFEKGQARVIET